MEQVDQNLESASGYFPETSQAGNTSSPQHHLSSGEGAFRGLGATRGAVAAASDENFQVPHDEWLEEFSTFQYQPLARLLDPEEENFAVATFASGHLDGRAMAMGGATASPLSVSRWVNHFKWRQERARVYAMYLADLRKNYAQLDMVAKLSVAMASEDCSHLVTEIAMAELEFRNQLARTRVALWGYRFGIGRPDAAALLDSLQRLEFGVRELHLAGSLA